MGPGDPFGRPASAPQQTQPPAAQTTHTPAQPSFDRYMNTQQSNQHPTPALHKASVSVLIGVVCGALLGMVALLTSWQGVLVILAMSALGGFIAWGVWALAHSQLRFGEAWRVLRNKSG